jgi:hypothetical protein
MAFKRSSVRFRLAPPNKPLKPLRFWGFIFLEAIKGFRQVTYKSPPVPISRPMALGSDLERFLGPLAPFTGSGITVSRGTESAASWPFAPC